MAVTDQQVAALRAYLKGEFERHSQLLDQLDPVADSDGWSALVAAGFFEAVDRRWGDNRDTAQIVEYIGSVRTISPELSDQIDPRVAEPLILACLGQGAVPDVDDETRHATQLLLCTALVADAKYDDEALDAFLEEARKIADHWLGQPA